MDCRGGCGRSAHQYSRVRQMLRSELPYRPPVSGTELDSEEIPLPAVDAVSDRPPQLAVEKSQPYHGSHRKGFSDLQTRTRNGYVFEVRNRSVFFALFVGPLHIDEIGTQQT